MENEGKGVIIHVLPAKRLLYNTYNQEYIILGTLATMPHARIVT